MPGACTPATNFNSLVTRASRSGTCAPARMQCAWVHVPSPQHAWKAAQSASCNRYMGLMREQPSGHLGHSTVPQADWFRGLWATLPPHLSECPSPLHAHAMHGSPSPAHTPACITRRVRLKRHAAVPYRTIRACHPRHTKTTVTPATQVPCR